MKGTARAPPAQAHDDIPLLLGRLMNSIRPKRIAEGWAADPQCPPRSWEIGVGAFISGKCRQLHPLLSPILCYLGEGSSIPLPGTLISIPCPYADRYGSREVQIPETGEVIP